MGMEIKLSKEEVLIILKDWAQDEYQKNIGEVKFMKSHGYEPDGEVCEEFEYVLLVDKDANVEQDVTEEKK